MYMVSTYKVNISNTVQIKMESVCHVHVNHSYSLATILV